MGFQNSIFCRRKNAIKAAQHHEREYYLAVLRLLEITAQRFRDLPDEIRERLRLLYGLTIHFVLFRADRRAEAKDVESTADAGGCKTIVNS
ncbi:MAG: hypothetical protein ABS35_33355 [Kaistia sp. SCN 65-12]|nr:MAG: hypothetical protein ABS35_33355 [Kaistia sp. SCN 65-12]